MQEFTEKSTEKPETETEAVTRTRGLGEMGDSDFLIPDRFPSVLVDRFACIMQRYITDMMIQMEMEFEHRLDLDRLRRALRLALDAEPILGCRFADRPPKLHWQRLPHIDREILEIAENEEQFSAFRIRRINAFEGPQLEAAVLREEGSDRLLIKLSHLVGDAGGTKEVVGLLANIYNRLAKDADYRPLPNCTGSREIWQVIKRIPWHAYPRIFINLIKEFISNGLPSGTFSLPLEVGPREGLVYITANLSKERVARIAGYGKSFGASLNDMLIAAFYRAAAKIGKWDGNSKLRLMTTIDLRHWYIPDGRGESISNLSTFEFPNLGRNLGADFDTTLARIALITGRRKKNWIGLNMSIVLPLLIALPHGWLMSILEKVASKFVMSGKFMPAFTNMGPIDPDSISFGKPPRRAWLLTPPPYPPNYVAGVTGYDGSLTLSAGAYPTARLLAEKMFELMLAELPQ